MQRLKLILSVIFLVFILYGFFYKDRVLPGVHLDSFDVSGMTRHELDKFLSEELNRIEGGKISLVVVDGDRKESIDLSFEELGVSYDLAQTAQLIHEVGRSPSVSRNFIDRVSAPFVKTYITPEYQLTASAFASRLDTVLAKFLLDAKHATIVYTGGDFVIEKERVGKTYDLELLTIEIRSRVENLSTAPISVAFVDVAPVVLAEDAGAALEKVKTLKNQKIVLLYGRDRWSLSGNKLLQILDFKPQGLGEEDSEISLWYEQILIERSDAVAFRKLDVSLNREAIAHFIDEIGNSIDVATQDASLVFDGERVTKFTPARDGQKLDRETTKKLLLSKVSTENVSGESEIAINLPVVVTRAKIASEEINSLGIRELIGRGVSYFAGSIPNRIHNLTLGSARISGTIVAPGEVFSFNKQVGEVSGTTGYKPAYVISSGRTVLDDGGGICQVSTTVFRAALASGLPIRARTAHAYRVGYYEQRGFRAGLDATVWSPAVDFAFKNDTDNHILVQAVVDNVNAKLQVDIYGTSDGRRIELSEPVVSNIRPAPEPKYQDDPSLPKGTIKQVDFAADGATSVFTRKVFKDTELVIDEVFKSNFRPWQAVYLVGTGG